VLGQSEEAEKSEARSEAGNLKSRNLRPFTAPDTFVLVHVDIKVITSDNLRDYDIRLFQYLF
jgi:hypothetical protein